MSTVDSAPQAVRRQLERVLESASFTGNERRSRFLRFVVEGHLEGRDSELKESVIAMEVFGNGDYDPKQDSIVRTEAGRLRARLAEYYAGEGSGDAVIIELPKGGYIPSFRQPEAVPQERKTYARKFWLPLALAAGALTLVAIGWWWVQHKSAPIAIAVLPLDNFSRDPADDYFASGLTDELIRNLGVIEGLEVRSRTSSFALKGQPRNVREAGRQLAVDYVLEGSVQRAGRQLRINAQLIRVRDDSALWSGKFDRELADIFAVQEEISLGIVNNLRLKLGQGRRRYETSVEAYDLYLRARAVEGGGGLRSIGIFEQAVAKDPSFAPAYAGLAASYAYRSGTFQSDRTDELAKMRAASEKAIQLDPLLAEAHDALGMAYARDGQWEQSEKSFRRALKLDPSRSRSYDHFAYFLLWPLGRIEEALQQLRVAEKADSLSPETQRILSYLLIPAGRYDDAADFCQKLPAESEYKSECLGRARLGQGRTGEAIQILEADSRGLAKTYLGHA
jgi:adenylate cyclase